MNVTEKATVNIVIEMTPEQAGDLFLIVQAWRHGDTSAKDGLEPTATAIVEALEPF